ncbi:class I SAM-dependent methyltransferase [Streptomyces sp. NPDC003832]
MDEERDDYAVSAEFYDVLQARRDELRVHRLYAHAVGDARLGVLDVGSGTGRVALMSLAESRVAVHAVEPARAMRASLMSRLASLPPELTKRVAVHALPLNEAALHRVADVAVCHNTVAALPPVERRALWPASRDQLVDDLAGHGFTAIPGERNPDVLTVSLPS